MTVRTGMVSMVLAAPPAAALGITGTPTFVVGTELVPGAVDLAALKALVALARAKAVPPLR